MADQRILYTEEMVGATHPTKADTLNRLALIDHNSDGTHKWMPATTKMLFKQAAAPTGWTVDDSIQDNSMVVYRRSASYGADGGSQSPVSMTTPAQDLDTGATVVGSGAVALMMDNAAPMTLWIGAAGTGAKGDLYGTVNTVTLTPYYTHVIVATKN